MKYYIMTQDKRIKNHVILKQFPTDQEVDFDSSYQEEMKANTVLLTKEDENTVYPDVLLAPLFMVEDKVYRVISMYDEEAVFVKTSLYNQKRNVRHSYWVALLDRIDCLHADSSFYKDQSVEHLILDKEKIRGRHIFKVDGIAPNWVIVSMPVAESVLRRDYYGVCFNEVEVR